MEKDTRNFFQLLKSIQDSRTESNETEVQNKNKLFSIFEQRIQQLLDYQYLTYLFDEFAGSQEIKDIFNPTTEADQYVNLNAVITLNYTENFIRAIPVVEFNWDRESETRYMIYLTPQGYILVNEDLADEKVLSVQPIERLSDGTIDFLALDNIVKTSSPDVKVNYRDELETTVDYIIGFYKNFTFNNN